MNGTLKWHKANGPAFAIGEEWRSVSGNVRCWIVGVRKFGSGKWDYEVTYRFAEGPETSKDAWNFQVKYFHVADRYV